MLTGKSLVSENTHKIPLGQFKNFKPLDLGRLLSIHTSKIVSETAWSIKVKFYVEHPWVGETKVWSRNPGHMIKMAAMPIYGKNHSKIFFSRTGRPIFTKLGMYHLGLQPIIVCSMTLGSVG